MAWYFQAPLAAFRACRRRSWGGGNRHVFFKKNANDCRYSVVLAIFENIKQMQDVNSCREVAVVEFRPELSYRPDW